MADETVDTKKTKKGLGKYKWWIAGGAVGLVMVFLIMRSSGSSSSTNTAAQQAASNAADNIDPQTGYLSGSAADLAALGETNSASETGSTGTTNNYYSYGAGSTTTASGGGGSTTYGGYVGPTPVASSGASTGFPSKYPTGQVAYPLAGTTGYTVQPAESLGDVSAKTGVSIANIQHANAHVLGSTGPTSGMRLTIPK
jgi:hypothetical protein